MIQLVQVMKSMRAVNSWNKPIPFSIQYVKADRRRHSAGEIVTITNAIKRKSTASVAAEKHKDRLAIIDKTDQGTELGSIVNVYDQDRKKIMPIHVRLITAFNDERVIY
jgi:hypothetical protein